MLHSHHEVLSLHTYNPKQFRQYKASSGFFLVEPKMANQQKRTSDVADLFHIHPTPTKGLYFEQPKDLITNLVLDAEKDLQLQLEIRVCIHQRRKKWSSSFDVQNQREVCTGKDDLVGMG